MSPLTTAFQHHTKIPSECNETRKGNKSDTSQKEINLSSFTGDVIIYVENPNKLTTTATTHLKLKSSYDKAVGYSANIEKSVIFLHTSNKQVEFEI